MRGPVVLLVTLAVVTAATTPAPDLTQIFKSVNSSVVVVRTRAKEVSEEGRLTKFGEVGSGVPVSQGGKVMTAAHVVHLADKLTVEFVVGENVGARVIASEPDADVSLRVHPPVAAGRRPIEVGPGSAETGVRERCCVPGAWTD